MAIVAYVIYFQFALLFSVLLLHRVWLKSVYLTNLIWLSNVALAMVVCLIFFEQVKVTQVNHDFCQVLENSNSAASSAAVFPSKLEFLVDRCIYSEDKNIHFLNDLGFGPVEDYVTSLNKTT